MSSFNSADIAAFRTMVFCEQREGKLMPTDFGDLKGRDLANLVQA